MTSIIARTGLTLAIAFAIILLTAPESHSASASGGAQRTCHLDAAEKRRAVKGVPKWAVSQLDRWCVRDGRVVTVRQTLEADASNGWRVESKSGTTRVLPDGSAVSQGRFHLVRRGTGKSCYPPITGTLEADGSADYEVEAGC